MKNKNIKLAARKLVTVDVLEKALEQYEIKSSYPDLIFWDSQSGVIDGQIDLLLLTQIINEVMG